MTTTTDPDVGVTYLRTADIPLDELTPFPGNAKRGDVDQIRKSLRRNGQYRSLVVREIPDGPLIVLAGNHTMQALAAEGHQTARCEVVLCDEDTARRINLADNRTAELGGYDNDALAELLSYMDDDYEGTGYTAEDVEALITPPDIEELDPAGPDEDDAGPPPAEPVTKPGDIWILGPHRIICGDVRDYATVERLLDGNRINIAFTSPPYASQRAYDESSGFRPIPPDEYVDWFEDVQANVRAHLADDGSWFVNIKEHCDEGQRHLYVKDLTIAHARLWGWRFVDEFAWTRAGVPGTWPNRFKNGWEPVFHFALTGQIKFRPYEVGHASDEVFHEGGRVSGTNTTGNVGWSGSDVRTTSGIALPSNVLDIHTNPASMQDADHPAAYPLALPEWFIRAYSDARDVVFDPFMGSGSTLLAAHRNDRIAYGTEISTGYCDVICRRFQQTTGIRPVLASTGEEHDFTTEPDSDDR
jgi:DNA modification methylase